MNKIFFYLQQSSLIEYGGVEMRLSSIKKTPNPRETASYITKSYVEHLKAWEEKFVAGFRESNWKPPPIGWLKFNFDVAIRPNKITIAVCCRNDIGEILYACSKSLPASDPAWGEAQVALLAISTAQNMGGKFFLFEGDAINIIEAFSKNSTDSEWQIRGIIKDAKSLLHSFIAWDFVHVHREANFFVHNLASWTSASNFDRLISISSIPNWLFVRGDGIGPSFA